ncbi:hypothetical protein IV454_15115 [Massilia antarctica]|uniref:Uncharacterized protein n=1 Tax=Massilia antarctica TaxID=2765360 RepID=A0AA49AB89_9BURK|nr:hypothetical protein [Massilia antarctica]QPI52697.1 hypothetical protein IV454_15115 [Massilia antarctica]
MISIGSDELRRIQYFIFAVQRLNGMADVIATWMAHGTMTAWDGTPARFADCEAAAIGYFGARPGQEGLRRDYLAALRAAQQIDQTLAAFLAGGAHGDLDALLEQASAALNQFAGVIDRLPDYPCAEMDAPAFRTEARHCLSLRQAA